VYSNTGSEFLIWIADNYLLDLEFYIKNIKLEPISKLHFVSFYTEGFPFDKCIDMNKAFKIYKDSIVPFVDSFKFYNYHELKSNPESSIYVRDFHSKSIHNHSTNNCGYLSWKPYILLQEINKLDYNDILFYRDCNVLKYKDILMGLEETPRLLKHLLNQNNTDLYIPIEGECMKMKHHVKKKVFDVIGEYNSYYLDAYLLNASIIVCRKTDFIINFLKEWLDFCLNDELIDYNTFGEPQDPEFKWNTQEQAILNVLIRKKQQLGLFPVDFPKFGFIKGRVFTLKNLGNFSKN